MRRSLGPAVTAIAASMLLALTADQAFATTVHCGDVITKDTTLDGDLGPCPGDGLVLGADGITVDLNGHLIQGSGFTDADVIYGDSKDGVDNTAGHGGVTIENGEIKGFDTAVKLEDASSNRLQGLNSHGNRVGAMVVESHGNRIQSNNQHGNGFGVYLVESDGNLVSGNDLAGNTFAIYGVTASDNRIWDNSHAGGGLLGCELTSGSNRNWIKGNSFPGSAGPGMLISVSVDNVVEDNVAQDNKLAGFLIASTNRTTLRRNRVVNAAYPQSTLSTSASGIQLFLADHTVLDRNVVVSYPQGIFVQDSLDVTISRNEAHGSAQDGISLRGDDAGTLMDRNVADGNGDDGIDVKSGSTTVSRNTANSNGDYGIEAAPGVGGGGNRAAGNGNPAQCSPASLCTTGKPKP